MSLSNKIATSPPGTGLDRVMWTSLKTTQEEAMSQQVVPSVALSVAIRRARAFLILAKPEITLMVMISAGVSCLMALESLNLIILTHTFLGTGLVAAGAAALNQFMERALDGNMRRTSKRPLPAGELSAQAAFVFGISLSALGTIYLVHFLNALTALLGLLTLFSYLFVYTPLKRKTRLCTLLGAFPGAAPVLMGWAAARNNLTPEAWALFAILFLWQFPHFYAIGWLYREDYARAGMLMLPAVDDEDGRSTFRAILISTLLLTLASLVLPVLAPIGPLYFLLAIILNISFYYIAYRASFSRTKLAAKQLLHASVIYLPLLYLAMLIGKIK